jgi:catechol 2,3-dioxygenase-like lactoylglutathione lyase family enzyme
MASFDHIGVYVKDLERSLEFYCKILGFPEQTRFNVGDSKIIVLDICNGYLELIQRPRAKQPRGGGCILLSM